MSVDAQIKQGVLNHLKHALQALALDADAQLHLFPDFVCKVDELALDFDHWHSCALSNYAGDFTETQKLYLINLEEFLHKISGTENSHLWTDDALRDCPEWEQIRDMARQSLKVMGWSLDMPPGYAHEFIPGR